MAQRRRGGVPHPNSSFPRTPDSCPSIRQFLVTFVISLMKSIDIRSESGIKLLAEFLDMDAPYAPGERHVNAEHFAHGPSFLDLLLLTI
jgi:hypothetical protein